MKSFFIKGLSIAFLVKGLGLLRDILTFYYIGFSSQFDSYILFLTIPALISSLVVPFVNLWVVPVCKDCNSEVKLGFLYFFIIISFFLSFLSISLSFLMLLREEEFSVFYIILIITSAVVLIFSILAEYSSSILISEGRIEKIYYSNLLINLPVVLYLSIFNVEVQTLAIISSTCFMLRFMYLNFYCFKYKSYDYKFIFRYLKFPIAEFKKLNFESFKKMSIGPSFQLSIYLGRFFCSFLPEGSLSLYYYGFKLFDAFKGTLLFVIITKYYSQIQNLELKESIQVLRKYLLTLTCIVIAYSVFLAVLWLIVFEYGQSNFDELSQILYLSFFTILIMFQYPTLVLYQRLVVSFEGLFSPFKYVILMIIFQLLCLTFVTLFSLLSVEVILVILSFGMIIPCYKIIFHLKRFS